MENIINLSSHFNQNDKKAIKENGVVFTNRDICDIIIKRIDPSINEIICEPSVGKGVFIFSLFEYFRKKHTIEEIANFFNNNLYCYDINVDFLNEFKTLTQQYFSHFNNTIELNFNNIIIGDFLLSKNHYDVIIGNPPYVRIQNIETNYLNILKSELKSVSLGNVDLYYAFVEKSLMYSKRVGFIIPNSFIKNKSGSFLRNIIKDRLSYLYDYKNEKVWKNISTYTSIIICDEKQDTLLYETNDLSIIKDKTQLTSKWNFTQNNKGSNKLIDLINNYSGSLATLKDDVFKMKLYDELYCYKNGYKIEKGICKRYIKATTSKELNENYIIYPYINGKVIEEDILKTKYPLCYEYLLSRKTDLLSRDKGKKKYDTWYAYGRKQGLIKEVVGDCIILPLTFLRSNGIHYIETNIECVVLSGILIDIKKGCKDEFIKLIQSEDFYDFCEMNNRILPGKTDDIWITLSTTTIKEYLY